MDCCNLVGAVSPILGSSTNGKSGKNVFRHPSRWKKKNISKSKITKPRRYKNLIHPNSIHFGCTEVLLVDPNIIKRTSNGQSHNQPSGKETIPILEKGTFCTEKAIVRKIDLNGTVIFLVWLIYFTT